MSLTNKCSHTSALLEAEKLEPGHAARVLRAEILERVPREALVDVARRAASAGAETSAQNLLVDGLVAELNPASPYQPGDLTRRLLATVGLNIDARVVEYRTLVARMFPGLAALPDETTLRHQIARSVPAIDLHELAAPIASSVLAAGTIADGAVALAAAATAAAVSARERELSWLEDLLQGTDLDTLIHGWVDGPAQGFA